MRNTAHSLLALLLLTLLPLYGQSKAESDRDEAEVKAYRLSMDKVRKLAQAQRNLLQLLKSDAAAVHAVKAQERAAQERDDDGSGRMLISRAQRTMEAHPKVRPTNITPQVLDMIIKLNEIAKQREQSLAQMAIAWLMKDKRVTSVLIGASKVEQIDNSIDALKNISFTANELQNIEEILKIE